MTPSARGTALLLGMLLAAPGAFAKDAAARFGSLGVGIGTNGMGVDYAYPVHPFIDLRAGYDFGSLDRDDEEEGIEYEGKLKFSSGRFLVDLKPFRGGFRVSAGLYTGAPQLTLRAEGQPDESIDVGDNTYNFDGLLKGKIDLGNSAPYLGIGWGGTAGNTGFGVSTDIGVIFTGAPSVKLRAVRGNFCDASIDDTCDPTDGQSVDDGSPEAEEFNRQVENERAELEEDAKDFDLWPVIRLGLHYRF
jgi:hypothetical protein